MSSMSQKTTRVAEALANLIGQFKSKDNFEFLITAFVRQSQELENAAFQVLLLTTLAASEGAQLDGLGSIVGVEREGRTDNAYRPRIGAQISLNAASGSIEDILSIALALGVTSAQLSEVYPSKIEIESEDTLLNGEQIGRVVSFAVSAGVGFSFTWFELSNPFRFGVAGSGFDQGEMGGMFIV